MTPEKLERARRIADAVIREHLDDVVFYKILVTPDMEKFHDDDPDYLQVRAIYEGEREQLRRRTLKLRTALRWRLYDEGITEPTVLYMTKKSEWDEHPDPA